MSPADFLIVADALTESTAVAFTALGAVAFLAGYSCNFLGRLADAYGERLADRADAEHFARYVQRAREGAPQ